jgi:ferritin-like metal-binding protein YciE
MKTHISAANDSEQYNLDPEKVIQFFTDHLNRIYCAKAHLQKQLPQMRTYANFTDLEHAITETLVDVEQQISRMNEIYTLMKIKPGFESCGWFNQRYI